MGNTLMKLLVAEYIIVAGAFALDGHYAKMFYFISAAGISLSVLYMK